MGVNRFSCLFDSVVISKIKGRLIKMGILTKIYESKDYLRVEDALDWELRGVLSKLIADAASAACVDTAESLAKALDLK